MEPAFHEVLERQVAIRPSRRHISEDPNQEGFLQEAPRPGPDSASARPGVMDAFQEGAPTTWSAPWWSAVARGPPRGNQRARGRAPARPRRCASAFDVLDADRRRAPERDHPSRRQTVEHPDRQGRARQSHRLGIALLVGRTHDAHRISCTPYYMSPEQIQSPQGSTSGATSTAPPAVIYEMLAGRPPFIGEGKGHQLRRAGGPSGSGCRSRPPVESGHPRAIDTAVLHGLAKEPYQRYAGCGEFRRALEIAGPLPEPIRMPPTLPRLRRHLRRRPRRTAPTRCLRLSASPAAAGRRTDAAAGSAARRITRRRLRHIPSRFPPLPRNPAAASSSASAVEC